MIRSRIRTGSTSASSTECGSPPSFRKALLRSAIGFEGPILEAGFTEWTDDGRLRHPRYEGLRHDKDPEDVVRERPS